MVCGCGLGRGLPQEVFVSRQLDQLLVVRGEEVGEECPRLWPHPHRHPSLSSPLETLLVLLPRQPLLGLVRGDMADVEEVGDAPHEAGSVSRHVLHPEEEELFPWE